MTAAPAVATAGFLRSSIGLKVLMAVSGIVLFGFVLVHMLGNLQVYAGPEKFNAYAAFLHSTPALLWGTRLLVLAAIVVHVYATLQIVRRARAARPVAYHQQQSLATTYAARTMRITGPIVLFFLLYHLAHFTTGHAHPAFVPTNAYQNFVVGFRVWWVSAFYVVAQLCLGLHLRHGLWSMLQSLGVNHPRVNVWRDRFATAFTALIVGANVSFPLAVMAGFVK